MFPEVLCQTVGDGKRHGTMRTLVWFFTSMDSKVDTEVAGVSKGFATVGAQVRPITCVFAQVSLIGAPEVEAGSTVITFERLLPGVGAEVFLQGEHASQDLAAAPAGVLLAYFCTKKHRF